MTVRHFYHIHYGHGHVASRWKPVAEEHFQALKNARFDGEVHVGLVGDRDRRESVAKHLTSLWPRWMLTAEADEGYEQVTIQAMHKLTKTYPAEDEILYCHTKGAYQDHPFNHNWRQGMTGQLVGNWEGCVNSLHTHDVVACHWLTSRENHAYPGQVGTPMPAGNFWWSTAGYLASLSPVEGGNPCLGYNRFKAEEWVGTGNPRVLDLKPGWPEYDGASSSHGTYDSAVNGRLHE